MTATHLSKQPLEGDYDFEDENSIYVTRSPNSVRKYRQPVRSDDLSTPSSPMRQGTSPQRRRSSLIPTTGGIASKAIVPSKVSNVQGWKRHKHFPLFAILLGMVAMALLTFGLSGLGKWWQMHQDDATYGRPRTSQLDAVVGHGDSASNPTHFIFLNLNRHVEIIELPGGDATHAHAYLGPVLFGDGQDLTPVTGEVRDVNSDGLPDLILRIEDQRIVFINTGTGFRPQ